MSLLCRMNLLNLLDLVSFTAPTIIRSENTSYSINETRFKRSFLTELEQLEQIFCIFVENSKGSQLLLSIVLNKLEQMM